MDKEPKLTPKQSIEYQLYLCSHNLCNRCQFVIVKGQYAYCQLKILSKNDLEKYRKERTKK